MLQLRSQSHTSVGDGVPLSVKEMALRYAVHESHESMLSLVALRCKCTPASCSCPPRSEHCSIPTCRGGRCFTTLPGHRACTTLKGSDCLY